MAGGPVAMILTVLVGILVNNAIGKAHFTRLEGKIDGVERVLKSDIHRLEGKIDRVEGVLKAEMQRVSM